MSYVLGVVVAATVLGTTPTGSEEVGCLGMSVRWVDDGVTGGTSLKQSSRYGQHGRDQRRRIGAPRDDRNY